MGKDLMGILVKYPLGSLGKICLSEVASSWPKLLCASGKERRGEMTDKRDRASREGKREQILKESPPMDGV